MQTAGNILEAQNLWLESDNLDLRDKLKACYHFIAALRKEQNNALKKLEKAKKALKPTLDDLSKANNFVTSLKKEQDDAVSAKAKVDEEVKDLSTKV